ncbi:MAG TPA: SDR family oxidoreductase [Solirubrobacteraceae bacterium]|nr:SDR family oxidoreductase [Solirubrobacteraceae bacterium]
MSSAPSKLEAGGTPGDPSRASRVAAVSGAAGEVGQAVVGALLERGWAVAAFDAVTPPVSAARGVTLDPRDRDAVRHELEAIAAELGDVDCLIAVAQPSAPRPVAEIAISDWRAALDAQLLSVANFAWAVLPAMLRRRCGNIVTVGSDVARGAPGGDAMQAAAAGSVIGFAKALAIELAKTGVQVNAISAQLPHEPSDGAGSSANDSDAADDDARRVATTPLGRPVLAAEIAATAAYLAGERHFFLGQILSPNGGRVI